MNKTASQPSPEPPPPAEPKKDPGTGNGNGNSQNGLPIKEPPTVMKLIKPAVQSFACSLVETDRGRMPSPACCASDPWQVPIANENDRVRGLLFAGAQFAFAADASPFEGLRDLFRRTAQELFRHGLHHPTIATA